MGREPVLESGGLLDRGMAWCWVRPTSERATRGPSAGFWRVGGRVEDDQELRKPLAHAGRSQGLAGGTLRSLPGEALIVDGTTGQAELGVGEQHQPGPAIS